jgi:hypothetical protein
MHVKSVAIAMTNISWNLLTAAGLRNEISSLLTMSLILAPPFQHLHRIYFPPWVLLGQKLEQEGCLLKSLDGR